jgi:NTE family protein
MKKALVLGSGGLIGGAWEVGVLKGLLDIGINPGDADLVVGSSVGASLGISIRVEPVQAVVDRWMTFRPPGDGSGSSRSKDDGRYFEECCKLWGQAQQDLSVRIELGRRALATPNPISETAQVANARTRFSAWPDRPLKIVSVDVEDGSACFIDQASGVPIEVALAASSAQPGLQAPIHMGGRRCMDGGVAGTNIDGAIGCGLVLAITAFPAGQKTRDEIESVCAAGGRVVHVAPDEPSKLAMGPSLSDWQRVGPSIEAGAMQARTLLELEELATWNT